MNKLFYNDIEEHFKQFKNYKKPKYNNKVLYESITKLEKELNKINVKVYYFKWTLESLFLSENLDEKINKYLKLDTDKELRKNGYIFFDEGQIYQASITGEFYIQHTLKSDITNDVNKILKKIFPNRTLGFTTVNDSIRVYLYDKKLVIPKAYSLYYIYAKYKDKKFVLSDEQFNNMLNIVTKYLTDKVIYMYYDAYNNTGHFTLFYYVYDNKIKIFEEKVNKLKNIKKLNLPELIDIGIAKN